MPIPSLRSGSELTEVSPPQFDCGSVKERDPEKLKLLYDRLRDVCLVEKEVWKEIYLPRDAGEGGLRLTNVQDRYAVTIANPDVEAILEANILLGPKALEAAINEYRSSISFEKS